MSEVHCAACGLPLSHINEACPNCLAGSGLTDRPPTHDRIDTVYQENRALKAEIERLREAQGLCPLCGHPWKVHDPADGKCDAGPPCDCGRDIRFSQKRNAELSRRALEGGGEDG